MNRMPEVEHFPACGYYGLGIVPYSPMARGVLTGKYLPDAPPDKNSRAGTQRHPHDADRVAAGIACNWRRKSAPHAEAKGITAGQFAVAWVLNSSSSAPWWRGRAPKSNGTAT